jgi:hypothetical protein
VTISGALALLLTLAALRLLLTLGTTSLPRLDEITIDAAVMMFALTVALLSSLLVGLLPALQYTRRNVIPLLRVADRTSSESPEQRRTRGALVVGQESPPYRWPAVDASAKIRTVPGAK